MARTAVIAGVGPGLGESLARKFTAEGLGVGLIARSEDYVTGLAADLRNHGHEAVATPGDLTQKADVAAAFTEIRERLGTVDVLVNHASGGTWQGLEAISVEDFEQALRVGPTGGLLCSKEAVADMRAGDGGTIIFTGATSAIRGREGAIGFSAAKFAVRGMAESMARELGPDGIHVAHVIIDGQIRPANWRAATSERGQETYLAPESIAETYWHLIEQDRSAWSLEVDLRPHVEDF